MDEKRPDRLLRSKMALYGDNLQTLTKALGLASYRTLSRKISGKAEFKQSEMSVIKSRYHLTDEEYAQIFTKEVVT